jgi:hypothetical protein
MEERWRKRNAITLGVGEKGKRLVNSTAGNGRETPEAPNTANERMKIVT